MNELVMETTLSEERKQLLFLLNNIHPFDDIEEEHLVLFKNWVHSGEPLYRISKPAVPNKHLAVFSVVVDESLKKMLMVHHKDAGLWLPPGGHVDSQEHPLMAAKRELNEEIKMPVHCLNDLPLMLSWKNVCDGSENHTDATFWYLFQGDARKLSGYDDKEFHSVQWVPIELVKNLETSRDVRRFINRISIYIESSKN